MSDSDTEDNVIRYGTPLEPYEEDEVPSKRKFQEPTDQYAVDAHGRRRFHGAFTGGFSAGFGNTVGSQEGWTPQTFKSSRQEKAAVSAQRPEDFMDEEDRSEFGIAPKYMQTSSEFSGQKRQRPRAFHDGPIPGEPVLDQILQPVHETAAVHMLKAMGWRAGQGTGLRQSKRDKQQAAGQHRVYGCYMPEELRPKENSEHSDSSDSEIDYDTLFAPDDYEPYVLSQKNDRFGLGYKGLSRHSVLGNLVGEYGGEDQSSRLVMKEKGKKVSIRGQAFGVGAFEADDDDIYATEDMSHYDYTLGPSKDLMKKPAVKQGNNVLQGFSKATNPCPSVPSYPAPALPRDFAPLPAGARRSRFQPTDAPQRDQGLGRHDLTAEARGKLLGEEPPPKTSTNQPESTPIKSKKDEILAKIMGRSLDFVSTQKSATEETNNASVVTNSASVVTNSASVVTNSASDVTKSASNPVNIATGVVNNASDVIKIIDMTVKPNTASDFISIKDSGKELVKVFKPFATNPKKQARYEAYCAKGALERDGDMDRLSEWEREREMVEFEQAAKLYKPLTGIMGDRFTHASQADDAVNPLTAVAKSATNYGLATADQIDAAKKGVYGVMTRTSQAWRPDSVVCKRFNVPEPNVTRLEPKKDDRPKISYSVFSYMESSIHDKNSFTKEQGQFSGSKSHREADTARNDTKIHKPTNTAEESTSSVAPNTVQTTKEKNVYIEKISEQNNPSKRLTVAVLFIKESEAKKEQGKEVTETIESFDKMDLYKSIFLSDSEDEVETKVENNITTATEVADFVEAPKNIARNTSPPRGIFANINFDELNSWRRDDKSKETSRESEKPNNEKETVKPEIEEMEVETYGPKIPDCLKKRLESDQSESYQNTSKDSDIKEISSDDSWVDAKEVKTKKAKKKKKHKSKDKKKSKHKKKDR